MNCPECQKAEVTASGVCPACGFRIEAEENKAIPIALSESAVSQAAASSIARLATEANPLDANELPEWRRELTRRLQRIKVKREQEEPDSGVRAPDAPIISGTLQEPEEAKTAAPSEPVPPLLRRRSVRARSRRVEMFSGSTVRKPEVTVEPRPAPNSQEAARAREASIEEPARKGPPPVSDQTAPIANTEPDEIRELIDSVVAKEAGQQQPAPVTLEFPLPSKPEAPLAQPETNAYPANSQKGEKLILLSRTLSGLVDLLIVILCAGACVLAADILSGIVIVDSISLLNYSLVLLAVFFLYSTFFLGTTNQTIGMMITELRLVDEQGKRPDVAQILLRCASFLLSLLGFGAGLIWGFFDLEAACLHDKLSHTRVARLSSPSITGPSFRES